MGILDGKVAIITGAARGIGRACAEEFLKQGASVLINDLGVTKDGQEPDPRVVREYVDGLKSQGAKVASNASDASTKEGAKQMVDDCLAAFGTVDILYTNAGALKDVALIDMPDALWHLVMRTHVKGFFHPIQAVLPHMLRKGSGVILNTSSPGAMWGSPNLTHYAAAKGATHSFGLVLYKELYAKGIRVNTIIPGANTLRVATQSRHEAPAWTMPGYIRKGETLPERNGPLAAYLCSDEAATTSGQTVGVGGDILGWYPEQVFIRPRFMPGGWTIPGLQDMVHHVATGPAHYYMGDNAPPAPPRPGSLNPDKLLDGKVAIVTGGGRGIGRAAALLFAQLGAKVVVNDFGIGYDSLTPEGSYAHEVAKIIRDNGGKAVANTASVAEKAGAESIIKDALDAFGTIDILYNNAGFAMRKAFADITETEWDVAFDASITGTYYCSKAALPVMLEKRSGRIINTSSPGGLWGAPMSSSYGAAKGAVAAFTRALYKEVYEQGITVNTLVPGAATRRGPAGDEESESAKWVRFDVAPSSSRPVPGLTTPERVAPLTAYLASDEAGDITGRTWFSAGERIGIYTEPDRVNAIAVDGGWTVASLRQQFRAVVPAGSPSVYIGGDAPDYAGMEAAARKKPLT